MLSKNELLWMWPKKETVSIDMTKKFGENIKQVFCQTAINDERLILKIYISGIKI